MVAVQAAIGNIKDYVDVSNSYSTEETLTGGTWVDGKPIYRKCWTGLTFGSTSNSWTNTGATIQDVDEVIHCVGLVKASGETGTMMMSFRVNSNNNIQYNSPNTWGTTPKALILEYTKTTDPIP